MSAPGLHEQHLIGADLVQVRLCDIFVIFDPSGGQIERTLRIFRDKVRDDLTVFRIIRSQTGLCEIRLPDGAVAGQIAVAVGLQEAGIDEVLAVVKRFSIRSGKLFRGLCVADIGEHAVLHHSRFRCRASGIHGNDVAENNSYTLFHALSPPFGLCLYFHIIHILIKGDIPEWNNLDIHGTCFFARSDYHYHKYKNEVNAFT